MSPNTWGPPLWIFLHTFSIHISEEGYQAIGEQFFTILLRISKSLPCPECATHAYAFLSKVNPATLKTKTDLINMLYLFHNTVNKRKMKPLFHYTLLRMYERVSIIQAYNNFVATFITTSSRLMNENLQRKMLVSYINKWLVSNIKYFIKQPVRKVETSTQEETDSADTDVLITEDKKQEIIIDDTQQMVVPVERISFSILETNLPEVSLSSEQVSTSVIDVEEAPQQVEENFSVTLVETVTPTSNPTPLKKKRGRKPAQP